MRRPSISRKRIQRSDRWSPGQVSASSSRRDRARTRRNTAGRSSRVGDGRPAPHPDRRADDPFSGLAATRATTPCSTGIPGVLRAFCWPRSSFAVAWGRSARPIREAIFRRVLAGRAHRAGAGARARALGQARAVGPARLRRLEEPEARARRVRPVALPVIVRLRKWARSASIDSLPKNM